MGFPSRSSHFEHCQDPEAEDPSISNTRLHSAKPTQVTRDYTNTPVVRFFRHGRPSSHVPPHVLLQHQEDNWSTAPVASSRTEKHDNEDCNDDQSVDQVTRPARQTKRAGISSRISALLPMFTKNGSNDETDTPSEQELVHTDSTLKRSHRGSRVDSLMSMFETGSSRRSRNNGLTNFALHVKRITRQPSLDLPKQPIAHIPEPLEDSKEPPSSPVHTTSDLPVLVRRNHKEPLPGISKEHTQQGLQSDNTTTKGRLQEFKPMHQRTNAISSIEALAPQIKTDMNMDFGYLESVIKDAQETLTDAVVHRALHLISRCHTNVNCPAQCDMLNEEQCEGAEGHSHHGAQTEKNGKRNASGSRAKTTSAPLSAKARGKRKAQDDADKQDDSDNENPNKRPQPNQIEEQEPDLRKRLACPFFQRSPGEQKNTSCSGPGFKTISHLKQHIDRVHTQKVCPRCLAALRDVASLTEHLKAVVICNLVTTPPLRSEIPDTIDEEKARKVKDFIRRDLNEPEEKWKALYRLLFDLDDQSDTPSPYYEYGNRAGFSNFDMPNPERIQQMQSLQDGLPLILRDVVIRATEQYLEAQMWNLMNEALQIHSQALEVGAEPSHSRTMVNLNKPPHDEPRNDSAYQSYEEPFPDHQFTHPQVSFPNPSIAFTEAGHSSRTERHLSENIGVGHNQATEGIIEATTLPLINIPSFQDHQALNDSDEINFDWSQFANFPPQSAFSNPLNAPGSSAGISPTPTLALEEPMAELGQPSNIQSGNQTSTVTNMSLYQTSSGETLPFTLDDLDGEEYL